MGETLGLDADSVAKGESFDAIDQELKNVDAGDRLRALLTGTSIEDVTEAKGEQFNDKMRRTALGRNSDITDRQTALGLEDGALTYRPGEGADSFNRRLKNRETRLGKLEAYKAIPGANLATAGININSSAADIDRAITTATEDYQREKVETRGCYLASQSE